MTIPRGQVTEAWVYVSDDGPTPPPPTPQYNLLQVDIKVNTSMCNTRVFVDLYIVFVGNIVWLHANSVIIEYK